MLLLPKSIFILQLSIILTIPQLWAAKDNSSLPAPDFFEKPFCMIGNGKYDQKYSKKLQLLRRYQSRISRKVEDFNTNKIKESNGSLHGSPKWIAIRYLRHKNYSWEQINFIFYAMTLFAEAKNLDEKSMSMVAKVINNRKKEKNYVDTVTKLAQFSSWYYKNQRDNVVLLCPSKKYHKFWRKSVMVASRYFNQKSPHFKSTHYFAPRNMVPRYRLPVWAKGKHAVGYGGHIFIVKKDFEPQEENKKVVYIPKDAKRIRVVRGKIHL